MEASKLIKTVNVDRALYPLTYKFYCDTRSELVRRLQRYDGVSVSRNGNVREETEIFVFKAFSSKEIQTPKGLTEFAKAVQAASRWGGRFIIEDNFVRISYHTPVKRKVSDEDQKLFQEYRQLVKELQVNPAKIEIKLSSEKSAKAEADANAYERKVIADAERLLAEAGIDAEIRIL